MKNLKLFISFQAIVITLFIGNIRLSATYSQELQDAYQFAYKNGITTMNSIDKADMNGGLTRIAMAKMLSQYAINILGKTPDKSKTITFPDVSSRLDNDYNNGVTLAYQLGIMGIGIDKFRPFDNVTRAEFGTALSRVLYGDTYNQNGNDYYFKHLNALKNAGIMTKIDTPFQLEIRGYVMLMLMRSNGTGNINCNDPITLVECALNEGNCPCGKEKNSELTGNESSNESSNLIEKNIKLTAYSSKGGNDIITKDTGIIKIEKEYTKKLALDSVNIKGLDEQWFEHGSSMIDITLKVDTNIDYNNIKNISYESSYHGKNLTYNSIPVNDYILLDNKTQLITIPVELGYADKHIYGPSGYVERSVLFSVELNEFEPYDGKFISFEIVDIKQPSRYYSSNKSGSVIYAKLNKSSYYPGIYAIPAYIPGELFIQYKGDDETLKMEENIRGSTIDLGVIKVYRNSSSNDIQLKGVTISTDSNIDLGKYIDRIKITNDKASNGFSRKIENNKIIINCPENKEGSISLYAKFNSGFFSGGEKEVHFFIADKSDLKYTIGTGSDFIRNAWLDGPTIRTYSSIDSQSNNNSTGVDNSTGNSQSDNTQTNNETNNNENTNTQPDNTSPNNTTQNDGNSNNSNDEHGNESNNSESSSSSTSNSNCVDIEVDGGNSYNFCIVKWKSNGSKYSVKVDNAKDLSLCTVGKGGQNYDFYDCEGDITLGSSGISQLQLSIRYNNKTYSKKVDYDLTNGVFIDN